MTPTTDTRPAWVASWDAIAKYLPTPGLRALAEALRTDSEVWQQGGTTWVRAIDGVLVPVPGMANGVAGRSCAAGCPVAYAAWQGDPDLADGATVGQVYHAFAKAYAQARGDIGEVDGARWLLNFVDSRDRQEVRALLLVEVVKTLAERGAA